MCAYQVDRIFSVKNSGTNKKRPQLKAFTNDFGECEIAFPKDKTENSDHRWLRNVKQGQMKLNRNLWQCTV